MMSSLEKLETNLFQKSHDLELYPWLKSELTPENNIPGNIHNTIKKRTQMNKSLARLKFFPEICC